MDDPPILVKALVTFALMGSALWFVVRWNEKRAPPPLPPVEPQVSEPSAQPESRLDHFLNRLEHRLVTIARSYWRWHYRRGIRSKGGRMFYDAMSDVIQKREIAEATQPKVAALLEIPTEAIWHDGVKFDRPDVLLPWTATEEDFQRDFPRASDPLAAEVVFLGCNFHHVGASHTDVYMWPHRGKTLTSIYLTGPFRSRTEILPEYQFCAEKLLEAFGTPSTEEELDSYFWPKHIKRCWETPFLKITHRITDFRDSNPVNSLSIERRHSDAYLERYPNFSGA